MKLWPRSKATKTTVGAFVECADCGNHFAGGNLATQLLRWKQHSDADCPNNPYRATQGSAT